MCGRFYNHVQAMRNWESLLKDWPGGAQLSYNISPTAQVPIVFGGGTQLATWGMVPSWSKDFPSKFATFNARIESAHEKASFKNAWHKSKTCLLPIGGYYEWKTENGIKQPYLVSDDGNVIVLAGLWEKWKDKLSFTILTQESSETLAPLHHRMPVFLDQDTAAEWLEKGTGIKLDPGSSGLKYVKVSTKVNNSKNEGPELIEPID